MLNILIVSFWQVKCNSPPLFFRPSLVARLSTQPPIPNETLLSLFLVNRYLTSSLMLRSRLAPDCILRWPRRKKKNQNGLRLSIWPCRFVLRHSRSVPLFFSFLSVRICVAVFTIWRACYSNYSRTLSVSVFSLLFCFVCFYFFLMGLLFEFGISLVLIRCVATSSILATMWRNESGPVRVCWPRHALLVCGCLAPNSAIDPMCWFLHSQPPCETNKKLECCETYCEFCLI